MNSFARKASPAAPVRRGVVLLVLCLAQFMLVLDISIVNVALPVIAEDLGFSGENLQLVVTAYALTFGGLLLLGGRCADLLGRRRVFVVGLGLFTGASLLCGLAQSDTVLVTSRALQGIGGALLSPAALSLLTTSFAEGAERNRALGVWGAVAAGGGAAGLLLGGVLTDLASWRWVFLINVPVGVLVGAAALRVVGESREPGARRIDIAGAVTVTGALMALVYGLSRGEVEGFGDTVTVVLLVAAVLLMCGFVAVEQRVSDPLVPFAIFRLPTLTGANITTALMAAVIVAVSFFLTLYFQQVLGMSPIETGLAFLPMTVLIAVAATVAAGAVARAGARPLLTGGMLALTAGAVFLSRLSADGSYVADALPGMLLVAVGLGVGFTVGTVAATAGVPGEQQGLASGLFNTSQQVGTAVGLAVLATVASSAAGDPAGGPAALVDGFRVAFLVAAGFGVTGTVAALLLVRESDCEQELARRTTGESPGPAGPGAHTSPCQPAVVGLGRQP